MIWHKNHKEDNGYLRFSDYSDIKQFFVKFGNWMLIFEYLFRNPATSYQYLSS